MVAPAETRQHRSVSRNRASHICLHRHADFIECSCGHLSVTDSDFRQHLEEMERRWRLSQLP